MEEIAEDTQAGNSVQPCVAIGESLSLADSQCDFFLSGEIICQEKKNEFL